MPLPKSPVVPGLEPYEQVYGEGHHEYIPLPSLRSKGPTYTVYSRWELSPEERMAVFNGADIYLMQQTHGNSYQPTGLVITKAVDNGEAKDVILKELGLDEELNERLKLAIDIAGAD